MARALTDGQQRAGIVWLLFVTTARRKNAFLPPPHGVEPSGPTLTQPRHALEMNIVLVPLLAAALLSPTVGGPFLFDAWKTVESNPVVNGSIPLSSGEIFRRDFWGQVPVWDAQSHKSFRPITTLTFHADYAYWGAKPLGFHAMNLMLHALVSTLTVPVAYRALLISPSGGGMCGHSQGGGHEGEGQWAWWAAALFCGFSFASHPVHTEAVQNITGRADVLMSLFFLLAFLVYSSPYQSPRGPHSKDGGGKTERVLPWSAWWVCWTAVMALTLASTLSKEQGITAPLACAAWELLCAWGLGLQSILSFMLCRIRLAPSSLARKAIPSHVSTEVVGILLLRALALLAGAGVIGLWRLGLNHAATLTAAAAQTEGQKSVGASAYMDVEYNPAASHPNRLVRGGSLVWIWLQNLRTVWLAPTAPLSVDWSGEAIPLVRSLLDPRLPFIGG